MAFGIALLLSFLSRSASSETLLASLQFAVKRWVVSALMLVGLVTPPASNPVPEMVIAPVAVKHHRLDVAHKQVQHRAAIAVAENVAPQNSMRLSPVGVLRHYNYTFEGKATVHGQACHNASVLVRLTNGTTSVTRGGLTDENGFYSLELSMDAAANEPVDWMMTAKNVDGGKVELIGRKIVTREEDAVTVENVVNFVDASPS